MMPNTYEFSLKPVTERRVPTFERILERARALTSASASWEPVKAVGNVQTFSHKSLQGKGPRWWARVSQHKPKAGGNAFDQLWSVLASKDRFEQEMKYNHDMTSATLLKNVTWGEDNGDVALSLFVEAGVKAVLVSVERIKELENGNVEWLAASSMAPGGSIPLRISEYFAIKRITAHVPKVEKWMEQQAASPPKSSKLASPSTSSDPRLTGSGTAAEVARSSTVTTPSSPT